MGELPPVAGITSTAVVGRGSSADPSAADRSPTGHGRALPRPPPVARMPSTERHGPAVEMARQGLLLEALVRGRAEPAQRGRPYGLAGTVRVVPLAPGAPEPAAEAGTRTGPWREGTRLFRVLGPAGPDGLLARGDGITLLLRGAHLHLPPDARVRVTWEGTPRTLEEAPRGLDSPGSAETPGRVSEARPGLSAALRSTTGAPTSPSSPGLPDDVGLAPPLVRSPILPARSPATAPRAPPSEPMIPVRPIPGTATDTASPTRVPPRAPAAGPAVDPARDPDAAILSRAASAVRPRNMPIAPGPDAELSPSQPAEPAATGCAAEDRAETAPRLGAGPAHETPATRQVVVGRAEGLPLAEALAHLGRGLGFAIEEVDEGDERAPQPRPAGAELEEGRCRFALVLPELGRVELRLAWSPRGVDLTVSGLPVLSGAERAAFLRAFEAALSAAGARGRAVILTKGPSPATIGGSAADHATGAEAGRANGG